MMEKKEKEEGKKKERKKKNEEEEVTLKLLLVYFESILLHFAKKSACTITICLDEDNQNTKHLYMQHSILIFKVNTNTSKQNYI